MPSSVSVVWWISAKVGSRSLFQLKRIDKLFPNIGSNYIFKSCSISVMRTFTKASVQYKICGKNTKGGLFCLVSSTLRQIPFLLSLPICGREGDSSCIVSSSEDARLCSISVRDWPQLLHPRRPLSWSNKEGRSQRAPQKNHRRKGLPWRISVCSEGNS